MRFHFQQCHLSAVDLAMSKYEAVFIFYETLLCSMVICLFLCLFIYSTTHSGMHNFKIKTQIPVEKTVSDC